MKNNYKLYTSKLRFFLVGDTNISLDKGNTFKLAIEKSLICSLEWLLNQLLDDNQDQQMTIDIVTNFLSACTQEKWTLKNKSQLKTLIDKMPEQMSTTFPWNNIEVNQIENTEGLFLSKPFDGDISQWRLSDYDNHAIYKQLDSK